MNYLLGYDTTACTLRVLLTTSACVFASDVSQTEYAQLMLKWKQCNCIYLSLKPLSNHAQLLIKSHLYSQIHSILYVRIPSISVKPYINSGATF